MSHFDMNTYTICLFQTKTPKNGDINIKIKNYLVVFSEDETQPGHVLGNAEQSTDEPERKMTIMECSIIRLLTHIAMIIGANTNPQVILKLYFNNAYLDTLLLFIRICHQNIAL